MSTTDTPPELAEIEDRLRAALTARAEQVQPEHLESLAQVAPLRPRWRSPWALLASAAVVLLVLGAVFQGVRGNPRSDDDLAPEPDAPEVVLPADVGRDWTADDLMNPARLDLDGDGAREKVVFLAEPSKKHDGRLRLQTTLSSTGEEAYGIAQLQSTIGVSPLDPIDADGDGDQELVLPWEDLGAGPGGGAHPLVFDLREGLLVQVAVEEPDLLHLGNVAEPGSRTDHYEMVRSHDFWIRDGQLWSSRSVNAFASGNMFTARPGITVQDAWTWHLDDGGVLQPREAGCVLVNPRGARRTCSEGARDSLPVVAPASTDGIEVGESAEFLDDYPLFDASVTDSQPPVVDVRVRADEAVGVQGIRLSAPLDVPDPVVDLQQPTGVFYDGVSLLVRSATTGEMRVLRQSAERLAVLDPVGEVPLGSGTTDDGHDYRSWVTAPGSGAYAQGGSLVTVVEGDDGTWRAWTWQMVSRDEMATIPIGTVCFDDVADPSTVDYC